MPIYGPGVSLRLRDLLRGWLGGGAPTPPAAIASIDAAGWSAQWASGTPPTFTPDAAPQTIAVTRAGFDAAGAPTSYALARTFTRRVRQVYPNQALDTASTVALDDYVYATDTIPGVTNNSTETSPKPIAAWVMPGRQLVGNSLHWELVAFHRDFRANRQVACVVVTASDGTNSVSQTVSATAISTLAEDANPIEVYAGDLDITGLATGLVTLNAKVYPWIGGAASVLDSSASSVPREFSPRYFLKNAARFAAPPLAYVASAANATPGNDGAGVVSTDPAVASAAPFLTVAGAVNGLVAASGVTGGVVDGCRIRVKDGVVMGASSVSARPQNVAAVIVERDPAVTRASAVVTLAASWRGRLGVGTLTAPVTESAILFRDVSVARGGSFNWAGEATGPRLSVMFWNVALNNGGFSIIWLSSADDYHFGLTITGYNGNLGQSSTGQHRLMRGVSVDLVNGGLEQWVNVGCRFTRPSSPGYLDPTKGVLLYANQFLQPPSTAAPVSLTATNAGDTIGPMAIVQNLIEVTHTTASTNALALSNDAPLHGNTLGAILAYNTVTGYGAVGRSNLLYDNNSSTEVRTHRLMRDVGNIYVQLNTKGDVFVGGSGADPTDAPLHTGQFAYTHGVGCQGNLTQFRPNSANFSEESQAYPGLGSKIGTSVTAAQFAPATVWTDYRGTTGSGGTAVAGAGGGTYTLAAGSPARGMVTRPGLAFDLAGAARAGSGDAAGAYA